MLAKIKRVMWGILGADDAPERIASGVAVGIWIGFTPTVGIHTLLTVALALVLRANATVAVSCMLLVTMPYLTIPRYWLFYAVGSSLVGGPDLDWQWFEQLFEGPGSGGWLAYWQFADRRLLAIIGPLLLGSFLVATPISVIAYWFTFLAVVHHRARQAARSTDAAGKDSQPSGPRE